MAAPTFGPKATVATASTTTATMVARTSPTTPHPPWWPDEVADGAGGCGSCGRVTLVLDSASDGLYGLLIPVALCRFSTPSGMIRLWPAVRFAPADKPLASAIRYHRELSPQAFWATDCSVSPAMTV